MKIIKEDIIYIIQMVDKDIKTLLETDRSSLTFQPPYVLQQFFELPELIERFSTNDIFESLLKEQQETKKEIEKLEPFFNELLKDDFIKQYHEFKNQKEYTLLMFFSKKGNHYAKNRPEEFKTVYKKQMQQYSKILNELKAAKASLYSDEELKDIKEKLELMQKAVEEQRKKREEEILHQKIKEEEKLELYLKTFKDSCQKFIFIVDEKTHHLINREKEINLYLTFGYEVFEPSPNNDKNFSRIFLKPSVNYKYTEDFEKALINFYEETK